MRLVLTTIAVLLFAAPVIAQDIAQNYNYTARTQEPVARSGEVLAGRLTWQCAGRTCTITGPWPTPGETACTQLAAEVGRLTEYGHPARRLDSAALGRCNAIVAASDRLTNVRPQLSHLPQPQVTPRPQTETPSYSAVTEMNASIAAPTHETITINPSPTERIFAIRDGGGDGEFGSHGPRVGVTTSIYLAEHCIVAEIEMTAVETQADWTAGRATSRRNIWCDPQGRRVSGIVGLTESTAGYVDHDWEIDTVVPGYGEVDARRTLPTVEGPVRSFIIMGDTNGDIVSNDNDGTDVGDLDDDGNLTVRRTSVQVQFNPIRLVMPLPEPAATASTSPGTQTIWVAAQHSSFHVLNHTRGDAEYYGHGPAMNVTSRLDIGSGGNTLVATITGSADETEGGDTRASGSFTETIWTAPPGWRIDGAEVNFGWWEADGSWAEINENALGHVARVSFTDTDHEHDFLVEGAGEAARNSGYSIEFAGSVLDARRNARSHVEAFRVIGDTNGQEAGSRTGVQVFYRALHVTLSPSNPSRARVADLDPDVFLDVPVGDFINRLSGGNSCGPQAGSRLLRYYGVPTTYEQFKRRVQSSTNFVSDQSLGTPPGTLRDRMNDLAPGFVHDVLPLGTDHRRGQAMTRIRNLLDQDTPVLTLISWGSQFAMDIYSPHDAAAMSHWVVVRGYNSRNRTFLIVDNGHAVEWSYELFETLFDYGQDLQYEAVLAAMNVEKGSIIYRQ